MRIAAAAAALLLTVSPAGGSYGQRTAATIEHLVERGESLWSIAAQSDVYDDPYLWPLIYKFNRDQITDPGRIYPQQRLLIPVGLDDETRRNTRSEAGAPQLEPAATSAVGAGTPAAP